MYECGLTIERLQEEANECEEREIDRESERVSEGRMKEERS